MNICVIDKDNCIPLTELFNFVSDFQKKTGFGLSDIYKWLNPDITEPEQGDDGYRWQEASADYKVFRSKAGNSDKKISIEIANAFFSVCENFKTYGGKRAEHIQADINRPLLTNSLTRVPIKALRAYIAREKKRTGVSDIIFWKLVPDEIRAGHSFYTYVDIARNRDTFSQTAPKELADCIVNIYSKIPGRFQRVAVREGLVVPPFGSKHSFSVSTEIASKQLREKLELVKSKGLYKDRKDFIDQASALLQVNVEKTFENGKDTLPRFRVAICLALLEGYKIPEDVLAVHHQLYELSKNKGKSANMVASLNHDQ